MAMAPQQLRAVALLVLLALGSHAPLVTVSVTAHSIKHVVVLMMENRSFDHMLGYLKQTNNSNIDGLTGTEFNYWNSTDPTSRKITVSNDAVYVDPDPGHSVDATTMQIFGRGSRTVDPPPMNGFVEDARRQIPGNEEKAMRMFNWRSVPVISTLAMEYALFDRWYAAVPGPTEVNRMYANSATSYGSCINDNITQIVEGYPQKSIFESVDAGGRDWKVYFNDISAALYFRYVRSLKNLAKFHLFDKFVSDCNNNTLPAFSWMEPRFYEDFGFPAADQHPDHDVSEGERFIKKAYETLRNSPSWEDTLLIITYDEHGGFYDHAPPPMKGVPNPDGINCVADGKGSPSFDFSRLGVRIPTIAISPWINKATLVHDPPQAQSPTAYSKYDHTSTLATVKKLFNLPSFLNRRDSWAGTFEHVFSNRTTPRTDCPTTLPNPPDLRRHPLDGMRDLSHLQESFLRLASTLNGEPDAPSPAPTTEGEGARYVLSVMKKLMAKAAAATSDDDLDAPAV